MVDTVTSQWLENGPQWAVGKFTNYSDGTGESGVVKVNATSSGNLGVVIAGQTYYPGPHLKVCDVWFAVQGMVLRMQWAASSNTDMLVLSGFDHWTLRDQRAGFGGLTTAGIAGATGNILFTTEGAAAGASYSVILAMRKGQPQA